MANSTDLRVVKTKRAIRNAFVNLLSEKDFSEITVTDIVSAAQVNRKTFYNHYASTYELLNEVENEILQRMSASLTKISEDELLAHPEIIIDHINSIINSDPELFTPLLHMQTNTALFKKLSAYLKEQTIAGSLHKVSVSAREFDYALEYVFSGILAVYQQWVRDKDRPGLDEVSSTIARVFLNGFRDIMA